jgi:hypothetical protein
MAEQLQGKNAYLLPYETYWSETPDRQGKARQDKARQYKARQGKTRQDKTWQEKTEKTIQDNTQHKIDMGQYKMKWPGILRDCMAVTRRVFSCMGWKGEDSCCGKCPVVSVRRNNKNPRPISHQQESVHSKIQK